MPHSRDLHDRWTDALREDADERDLLGLMAGVGVEEPQPPEQLRARLLAEGRSWLAARGSGGMTLRRRALDALANVLRPSSMALAASALLIGLVAGSRWLAPSSSPASYGYAGTAERRGEEAERFAEVMRSIDDAVASDDLARARDLVITARTRLQDPYARQALALRLAEIELKSGSIDGARRILDEEAVVIEVRRLEEAIRRRSPKSTTP